MEIGFTGTSRGMTQLQVATVFRLFQELKVKKIHLGDCVGADTQAYHLAHPLGIIRVGHPPIDPKARSFLGYEHLWQEKAYLRRDVDIAKEGKDGLIATPVGYKEVLRGEDGGTWSTIRYARKFQRNIWIVWPDGTVG